MERVSHREYLLWQQHFQDEWDQPTLTHYYLMQIAQEVSRVLSTNKAKIKLQHFLLTFSREKTPEEKAAANKSAFGQIKAAVIENAKRLAGNKRQP